MGRNVFIGPAYLNTDVTLQKRFFFGERRELDFRSEFYNVFNETNLTNIQGDISSSLFGHAQGAFPARNLQLGLKILF
jgi:sigma54-dependent transcription regulator